MPISTYKIAGRQMLAKNHLESHRASVPDWKDRYSVRWWTDGAGKLTRLSGHKEVGVTPTTKSKWSNWSSILNCHWQKKVAGQRSKLKFDIFFVIDKRNWLKRFESWSWYGWGYLKVEVDLFFVIDKRKWFRKFQVEVRFSFVIDKRTRLHVLIDRYDVSSWK